MIKPPLIKNTLNGDSYRLIFYENNKFIIFKDSRAMDKEAEFSDKIKEFNDEKEVMEFWNKIK